MSSEEPDPEKDLLRDAHDPEEFEDAQNDLLNRMQEQGLID